MDEDIEIFLLKDMARSTKILVNKNVFVSHIYQSLHLEPNISLVYQTTILNKSRSLSSYGITNGSMLVCVNNSKPNPEDQQFCRSTHKHFLCHSMLQEQARLSDLTQISIDNNPKKFRKFFTILQNYTQQLNQPDKPRNEENLTFNSNYEPLSVENSTSSSGPKEGRSQKTVD